MPIGCLHAFRVVSNLTAGVAAPHACRDFGLRVAVLNGEADLECFAGAFCSLCKHAETIHLPALPQILRLAGMA